MKRICGEEFTGTQTKKLIYSKADLQQENEAAVCYLGQHEQEPLQSSVHLQSGPQLQLATREERGWGVGVMRGEKHTGIAMHSIMDMLVQSLQAVDCHTQNHVNLTPQNSCQTIQMKLLSLCQKLLATCLCIWVHHIVELTILGGGKICLSYVQNLLHLVPHFPSEAEHCSRLGHGPHSPLQLVPHWQSAPHPQSAVVSEGEKKSMIVHSPNT